MQCYKQFACLHEMLRQQLLGCMRACMSAHVLTSPLTLSLQVLKARVGKGQAPKTPCKGMAKQIASNTTVGW